MSQRKFRSDPKEATVVSFACNYYDNSRTVEATPTNKTLKERFSSDLSDELKKEWSLFENK